MKKILFLMLSCVVMINFSGCAGIFDAPASLMSPPKGLGDLVEIEEVLENSHSGFEFSYPTVGEYRNAVMIDDFNNDGNRDAVAFYQTTENKNITIHLCVLTKKNDEWKIKFDSALSGIGIDRVETADICSDESKEFLIGCKLNNTLEQELNVYKMDKLGVQLLTQERYTDFCVCDLGASKKPQIAIFKLGSQSSSVSQVIDSSIIKNTATAKLISFSYQKDSIPFALGSANFDTNVISFSKLETAPISKNQNGIFVDAAVSKDTMITEIFYYDQTIKALFYDKRNNSTKFTQRNSLIESKDINSDGKIEIPKSYLCNGYSQDTEYGDRVYFTEWYSLDNKKMSKRVASGFLNSNDNYFIKTADSWLGNVTAKKDYDSREQIFCEWDFTKKDFGEEIFRIKVFVKSDFSHNNSGYTEIKSNDEEVYAVKINKNYKGKYKVSLEDIKNQIVLL